MIQNKEGEVLNQQKQIELILEREKELRTKLDRLEFIQGVESKIPPMAPQQAAQG